MKQKTAIRQLIEKLEWRIKAYADFNNGEKDVSSMLALREAKELESVNEQQIKDAVHFVQNNHTIMISSDKQIVEQYFNETFEKLMTTDKEELRIEYLKEVFRRGTLNVFDWFYSKLEAKDKEYASKIAAGDRLRMEDAMSAINEANELREKIKEQELIIHGIEEGAEQWKSLCADKDKELAELKIQLSNYAYQIDMAKRERDNAENSNQSLAKQITDLKAEIERLEDDYKNLRNLVDNHFQTLIARNYNNIGKWSNERQDYNFELIKELEDHLKSLTK